GNGKRRGCQHAIEGFVGGAAGIGADRQGKHASDDEKEAGRGDQQSPLDRQSRHQVTACFSRSMYPAPRWVTISTSTSSSFRRSREINSSTALGVPTSSWPNSFI